MAVHRLTLVCVGRQGLYLDQKTSAVHLLKNQEPLLYRAALPTYRHASLELCVIPLAT